MADMSHKGNSLRGSLFLFLASLLWGVAFVAQSVGMDYVEPFTFNAVRTLLGSVVLVPCYFLIRRASPEVSSEETMIHSAFPQRFSETSIASALPGGIICGIFLCIASNLQQYGIKYTTVGKAGFITAMYIVIVPISGVILGKKAGIRLWISVALAAIGLYLLSMTEEFSLGRGDMYVLFSALAFAFQIMAVDYYSGRIQPILLACVEFLTCGLLSLIPMFLTEQPSWEGIWAARIPILYAGLLSCAVAYTLQILGQRDLNPAVASLIMSLESVISALAGWMILHQALSGRELFGCVLMFAAILLAQLPSKGAPINRSQEERK